MRRLQRGARDGKLYTMNITVAYSSDENYATLTLVSAVSLLRKHPNDAVTIILLANQLTTPSLTLLKKTIEAHGATFQPIDVQKELSKVMAAGAGGYTSFSAYARLFLPELLNGKTNRVLYLDSDTLVADRLDDLWSMNLNGKAFAIGYDCLCNQYKKMIGLPADNPYFNSGVLLIDVNEWLQRACTEKIFRYMREVRADFVLGDQDFFSLALADDCLPLPTRYNFLTHYFLFNTHRGVLRATGIPARAWASREDFETACKRPAIHHFLSQTLGRPWYVESRHPMRQAYVEAATLAGVPEVAQQSRPMEFHYRLQAWLARRLPRPIFFEVARLMYRVFFLRTYHV